MTRGEIGAIRVGPNESWFQIPRDIAPKFAATLQRTRSDDDDQDAILIEQSAEGPRMEARENRKQFAPKAHARPFNRGPGGNGPGDGKFRGKPKGKPGFKPGPKPGGAKRP